MAIQTIPSTLIADNAISAAKIASGIISADDIADNSLTAAKISASTSPTFGGLTVDTDTLVVDSANNRVGIGTDNPNQKLNVSGGRSYFGANGEAYAIGVGYNGTRTAANQTYFIGATDATAPDLQFSNSDGDEKVRITHSGNVGIGITNAAAKIGKGNGYAGNTSATASGYLDLYNGNDGNTYLYNTGAFNLTFGTNNTERMRIDSSGNVGIGNTSPSSYSASADNLVVGSSGDTGITIVSGTVSNGQLKFADGTSGDATGRGIIDYNHASDHMALKTAATERMRIDSSGNVGIGTTNTTFATGGKLYLQLEDTYDTAIVASHQLAGATENPALEFFRPVGSNNDFYTYRIGMFGDDFRFERAAQANKGSHTSYSTTMHLDYNGNVGIGTTTAPSSNGGGLAIYKSDYPRITLRNSTSGDTTGDGFQAALVGNDMQWDLAESGNQKFFTGGTERMRITSSGYVEMASASQVRLTLGNEGTAGTNTANWVRGTGNELGFNSAGGGFHWEIGGTERMRILSSGGITFNGDTAAANALDDYEEGTWDPVINQSNYGNIGRVSSVYKGRYQKIGSVVHFQIYSRYDFSVVPAGSRTGSVTITLPFSQGGGTQQYNAIYISYLSNFLSSNITNVGGYILSGQANLTIKQEDYSGSETDPTISGSNNVGIMVAGFYYTYDI